MYGHCQLGYSHQIEDKLVKNDSCPPQDWAYINGARRTVYDFIHPFDSFRLVTWIYLMYHAPILLDCRFQVIYWLICNLLALVIINRSFFLWWNSLAVFILLHVFLFEVLFVSVFVSPGSKNSLNVCVKIEERERKSSFGPRKVCWILWLKSQLAVAGKPLRCVVEY